MILSQMDQWVIGIDRLIGLIGHKPMQASRVNPGHAFSESTLFDKAHSAALMRINHAGEVCAQALYQGQGLTASDPRVQADMKQAALEEIDHLAWCEQRLRELDSRPSYLNPLWYFGSYVLGACMGYGGDRWSLGFLAETERQVGIHLDTQLNQINPCDLKSKAIIVHMRDDEAKHETMALEAGGMHLPEPVPTVMRILAKLMTRLAYWI